MSAVVYLIFAGVFAFVALRFLLTASPATIANLLRTTAPAVLGFAGLVLMLTGRAGLGLPLIGLAALAFRRMGGVGRLTAGPSRTSRVRTAALEMILDQDSGEMTGTVLAGQFEGQAVEALTEDELVAILKEVDSDAESVQLLEAYLDGRFPGWRDRADPQAGPRAAGAPASRSMSKEEAYEVLGLGDGASAAEIREAHRRLMKRMHPDTGGSDFLAARINEAKEILLGRDGH